MVGERRLTGRPSGRQCRNAHRPRARCRCRFRPFRHMPPLVVAVVGSISTVHRLMSGSFRGFESSFGACSFWRRSIRSGGRSSVAAGVFDTPAHFVRRSRLFPTRVQPRFGQTASTVSTPSCARAPMDRLNATEQKEFAGCSAATCSCRCCWAPHWRSGLRRIDRLSAGGDRLGRAHRPREAQRHRGATCLQAEMQSSVRGYLLTGNDAFLVPYQTAEDQAQNLLTELRGLVADNPPQVARATRLTELQKAWSDYARTSSAQAPRRERGRVGPGRQGKAWPTTPAAPSRLSSTPNGHFAPSGMQMPTAPRSGRSSATCCSAPS